MKFILAVAVLVFAVVGHAIAGELNAQEKADDLRMAIECIAQENVDSAAAFAVIAGNFENVDDKLKCFTHCFLGKHGFTGQKIKVALTVAAKLSKHIGFLQVLQILAACGGATGANECEKSFNTYKCFFEHGGVSS